MLDSQNLFILKLEVYTLRPNLPISPNPKSLEIMVLLSISMSGIFKILQVNEKIQALFFLCMTYLT